MKLQSYQSVSGPRAAVQVEHGLVDIAGLNPSLPMNICKLFQTENWLEKIQFYMRKNDYAVIPFDSVTLLPPIPSPQKIICIGLNYADHAMETGDELPDQPVMFNKFPTALSQNDAAIEIPAVSEKVDYEAELVVVIGKRGKNIPKENAREFIAGFCCGNDVSARDWQFLPPARQWFVGKTFDTFAPIGPWLTTFDEIPFPVHRNITTKVNGNIVQKSNTRQFIFDIPTLIAWVSRICTLEPGDLIFTGTPPGVGLGRKPPVFLQPGDVCEIEIEGLGILRNPVVSSRSAFGTDST